MRFCELEESKLFEYLQHVDCSSSTCAWESIYPAVVGITSWTRFWDDEKDSDFLEIKKKVIRLHADGKC